VKQQRRISQEPTTGTLSSAAPEPLEIERGTVSYYLNHSLYPGGTTIVDAGNRFHRVHLARPNKQGETLSDRFEDGSVCEFEQVPARGKDRFILRLGGSYHLTSTQGAGWLLRSRYSGKPHYWFPLQPMVRTYDKLGRIISEELLSVIEVSFAKNDFYAIFRIPENNAFIEWVVWILPSNSPLLEELDSLTLMERQCIFLWGSHRSYTGPKDLYQYLIHGAVYKTDVPSSGRPWRRPYCEVDAHALYVTFHSLWNMTGKKIYQHMKTQLVFSVIARQEGDGAWRHGSWTDGFEVHYRHHCSAIHMLTADYNEIKNPVVGRSLKRAVDYLRDQYDPLSVGNWYLHDSLELSVETMRMCPVKYQYSRVLGKSPSNMLVLNTHLDALVALHRYGEVTGQNLLEKEITSGVNAAVAVIALNSAEFLYRILFKAIELTFFSDSAVKKLSLPKRAVRRLARQKLIPLLPRIKKIFPRLVMPNGYIDRNLSLNEFWYPYFLINVMDLLRFQIRFSIKTIETVIDNAVRFVERVGLEKWLNNERTAYAVGFWAEALYLYCLHSPDRSRAALAETAILLYASGQGIPPSLLGCNSEYICLADQVPCLWTDNDRIQVINLSVDPHHLEFILVNGTDSPQDTSIPRGHDKLIVLDQNGNSVSIEQTLTVPPRKWMQLVSPKRQAKK